MEREEDVDEIKLIKLLLVHDAKLDSLKQQMDDFSKRFDFFERQIESKESWIRKLIYLIIAVLGSLAGVGGFVKAILGAVP